MFKFGFDIDAAEDLTDLGDLGILDSVPQLISYSPLHIPLSSSSSRKATTLVRRDLFDARFQLISEGAGDNLESGQQGNDEDASEQKEVDRKALEYLDAPSDLVPGVYEGGLKTWECSLDLVDYLDSLKDKENLNGKKILDIASSQTAKIIIATEIHLQDYNASVLQLVTLPNLLLTWRTTNHPELKNTFLSSLQSLNITLRFFSGSWDTFDPLQTAGPGGYDLVLTAETIYRTDSLEPLINLMQAACTGNPPSTLENLVSSLHVTDTPPTQAKKAEYICLVAAKVLYFGVGGGVSDFLQAVERRKARVDTVLERKAGVGRKIMRVLWP
ncbi:hypothetical protein BJ912DRAFT_1034892 [Pholiota molesta]|nr:hypothetical protein BJ912DRAFT_1034892 [Pholiota molesta]